MKKVPTLFLRDPEDFRLTSILHPSCSWVLEGEGVVTRKYDGQCVMIDDKGHFYKRREVKRGKLIPLGFIEVDRDEVTGKRVGWVKVVEVTLKTNGSLSAIGVRLPVAQFSPQEPTKPLVPGYRGIQKD